MIFNFNSNANLLFGPGASEKIGETVVKYGKKALIVTGGSSAKRSGLLAKVESQLKEQGASFCLFDKAQPNPLVEVVEEGAEVAVKEECDVVVALGGGSVLDTAKAICARAKSNDRIIDMLYNGAKISEAIPMIAVPTTCGTGSEVNGISVLTNGETNDKKSIKTKHIVPKRAIVDPCLMMTMPKPVFASVAFDALCHLMEAYLSKGATPISDMYALRGMQLLQENIIKVYHDYENPEGWSEVVLASTLGGYTLDQVGVIAGHSLDHPAGGLKDIVHGQGLAAVIPAIFHELIPYAPERLSVISKLFGGQDERDCHKVIIELLRQLDLDVTLEELGFTEEDITWMSDNVFVVSAFTLAMTPGDWDRDVVEKVYRKAMTFNKE